MLRQRLLIAALYRSEFKELNANVENSICEQGRYAPPTNVPTASPSTARRKAPG